MPGSGPAYRTRSNACWPIRPLAGSTACGSRGSGDLWLDSNVTDFLTRAREEHYRVPDQAFALALDNLENALSYDANVADQGPQMAYAIYVLARNRRASIGDLRYFGDDKLESFGTGDGAGPDRRQPRSLWREGGAPGAPSHRLSGCSRRKARTGRAPTMARGCATGRQCWRWRRKASQRRNRLWK